MQSLVEPITPEQALEEAVRIGEEVWAHHLETPAGEVTWRGPIGYNSDRFPLRLVQIGAHLYHGTAGVALLFAALCRVTGEERQRERAVRTLAPLRRVLRRVTESPERAAALRVPTGGLIGAGSFVYALRTAADLLAQDDLLEDARRAATLITPERIAGDGSVRVQTGAAGAILALAALHERAPEAVHGHPPPLVLAEHCGRRIVADRVSFEGRPPAWPLSTHKPPLAGYSYGAAGICHALLRLWDASGRPEWRETAEEGLAFVRDLFVEERGAWRDMRELFERGWPERSAAEWRDWWASTDPPPARSATALSAAARNGSGDGRYLPIWCHGAAGIALGRLSTLPVLDDERSRREIGAALRLLQSYTDPKTVTDTPADDLCCGSMGMIETLGHAGRVLDDPALSRSARQLAALVVERARERGGYQLSATRGTDCFAPTLYQGLAGVGYTLLRLASPAELPCLLVFE